MPAICIYCRCCRNAYISLSNFGGPAKSLLKSSPAGVGVDASTLIIIIIIIIIVIIIIIIIIIIMTSF